MFDFLTKIKSTLNNLWGSMTGGGQGKSPEPLRVAKPVSAAQSSGTPTPTPQQTNTISSEQIQQGMSDFGGGTAPPIGTASASLAQLGNELAQRYPQLDPAFVAALALRESGGGANMLEGSNNPYGIMSYDNSGSRQLASYPDFETATLGGGQNNQQGLRGTLFSGAYDDAFKSGDLEQFFNTYSPPSENAPTAQQVADFLQLLEYFKRGEQ